MVFILLGAIKGAQAVKNEYQKDKKRNQIITTIEGSPSGPGTWYGEAASSSASSSPPSHNAIGCWSRDTPSEPNPSCAPPLPNLPPSQSSAKSDTSERPLVEQSLARAGGSNSGNEEVHVEAPIEEEQRAEKVAEKLISESVTGVRAESGGGVSRERKPRRVPPAAPLGSFVAAFQHQSQQGSCVKGREASGRLAEVIEPISAVDGSGVGKRPSVEMKRKEEVSSGVGRNERAMAAMARKRSAAVSTGESVGRSVEGGNERAKAAMARKRGSGVPETESAEAKLLDGTNRAKAAMARKRAGIASGVGGARIHSGGNGGPGHEGKGQHRWEEETGDAGRGKDGSFAESMRRRPQNSGAKGGVQQRKEAANGAALVTGEVKFRKADATGASNGTVTSMYAEGTMKRRASRRG